MKKLLFLLMLLTFVKADIIPKTWYDFLEFKPIKYGIMDNRHLPGHIFWVVGLGFVTNKYTVPFINRSPWFNIQKGDIEKWSLIAMSAFEFYQLAENQFDPVPVYGSVERWAYDSFIGDVIVPWLLLRAVLYGSPKCDKEHVGVKSEITYNPITKQLQFEWRF